MAILHGLLPSEQNDVWGRVSVVVVTHNSAEVISQCLERFTQVGHVIVVDNASDDETLEIVKRVLPDAHIIHNEKGLGFGNASNQGLKLVKTEFALHVNPDAIVQEGCIETLVATADAFPDAGMLGPEVVSPDGHVDKSFNVALHMRQGMSKDRSREPRPIGPCCTWFLSGAVLFYRMDALRTVNFFDPAIFLYFEDDDISSRFSLAGYSLLFVPGCVTVHIGGGSGRPSLAAHWEKFYHFSWSRLYYEAKYKGRFIAMKLGWAETVKSIGKLFGHLLTIKGRKSITDLARIAGSIAYLMHVPVSKTTRRTRPG